MPAPHRGDCGIFHAPDAAFEGAPRVLGGLRIPGLVDALEGGDDGLAILPGHEIQAIAQQMDDAGLHLGLRKHRIDGLWKAFEAIDDGDEDVLGPAPADLVHDAKPEFCAFILLDPQPESFLASIHAHAEGKFAHFGQNACIGLDPGHTCDFAPEYARNK